MLNSDYLKITSIAFVATLLGRFVSLPLIELFSAAGAVVVLNKYFTAKIRMPAAGLGFVQIILGMSAGASMMFSDLIATIPSTTASWIGELCGDANQL